MSNVTVTIVIQGLIALSPDYQGQGAMANHMSALAVDYAKISTSDQPPNIKRCMATHMAKIEFPSTSAHCTALQDIACDWSGGKCKCHLDRHAITILPTAEPTSTEFSRASPPNPLPPTNASAGNFSYVANLTNLGYSLDPRYKGEDPPELLGARFTFPFESLLACEHATRPDDQTDNVHSFQFHEIGSRGELQQLNQAIAQRLIAKVNLGNPNESPYLQFRKFGSTVDREIPLKIVNPAEGVTIKFENHRSEVDLGDPCDDGIGRDFGLFYELVQNPPLSWEERLLPHVKFTSWKPQPQVEPAGCPIPLVVMSRPVCPLAAF